MHDSSVPLNEPCHAAFLTGNASNDELGLSTQCQQEIWNSHRSASVCWISGMAEYKRWLQGNDKENI